MKLSDIGKSLLIAFVLFAAVGLPWLLRNENPQGCLVVTASTTVAGEMQVFSDTGDGMSEEQSVKQPLVSTGTLVEYRFPLPRGTIRQLRLDPMNQPGEIVLAKVEIVAPSGKLVRRLRRSEMSPALQIESFDETPRGFVLKTPPGGNDSALLIDLPKPLRFGRSPWAWLGRLTLGYGTFFLLSLALLSTPLRRVAEAPRRFLGRYAWLPFCVCGAICWVYYLSLPAAGSVQLDASWQQAATQAHDRGLVFGRDFIFTAGPFGYLFTAFTTPESLGVRLFWEFSGKVFLIGAVVASLGFLSFWRKLAFLLFCIVYVGVFPDTLWCVLILLLGVDTLIAGERPWWRDALAVAILAFFSLAKFSFLFWGVAAIGCAVLAALLRRAWLRAAILPAAATGGLLLLWLLAGQPLTALPAFFLRGLELSDGYAWSMACREETGVFASGLAVAVLSCAAVFYHARGGKPRFWALPMALFCAATLYLAWRHGFTRADGHVREFFGFALILACLLPAIFRKAPRLVWSDGIFVLCVLGFWLDSPDGMRVLNAAMIERFENNFDGTVHIGAFPERWRAGFEGAKRENALPQVRAAVGREPVDVFNHPLGYALLNDLNYSPRPVPQSYSVHTVGLEGANLEFYRSHRAPRFVLFRFDSIDERYPTQDDALVLAELPRLYEPVLQEKGLALLRRREGPLPSPLRRELLSAGPAALGTDLPLPIDSANALWLQVKAEPTLLGLLRALAYRPATLTLVATDETGTQTRHRLLPKTSGEGFLIYPALRDQADFEAYLRGRARHALRSIRIECADGTPSLWRPFEVTVSRLPDLSLAPRS